MLVVDDDPVVSDVVRRYLEQDGCAVELASDGLTALAKVQATAPDLIVLDLMLGGIDGLEVCRRLRRDRPHLPIVMLTALGEEWGWQFGDQSTVTVHVRRLRAHNVDGGCCFEVRLRS